ncbi:hypothetical protein EVAR_81036_1 [Eumeta japonica]|uniref:Uncharacterized protein n=1 Tax=Eumeta variegata TaxID=151549 RepID=A0A4C1T6D1_EUMVA|nr:hypothetical protein EVAR_81036_1 [Eumeta japonica]
MLISPVQVEAGDLENSYVSSGHIDSTTQIRISRSKNNFSRGFPVENQQVRTNTIAARYLRVRNSIAVSLFSSSFLEPGTRLEPATEGHRPRYLAHSVRECYMYFKATSAERNRRDDKTVGRGLKFHRVTGDQGRVFSGDGETAAAPAGAGAAPAARWPTRPARQITGNNAR